MTIDLLQDYIFVPLDIFKQNLHNGNVDSRDKLVAWLTFLCEDDPKWILALIKNHPEFKQLYQEVYEACQETEVIMGIFSKELIQLDQNTVDFMIDEMQDTIDSQKTEIIELKTENQTLISEKEVLVSENTSLASENNALASENKLLLETIAQLQHQLFIESYVYTFPKFIIL